MSKYKVCYSGFAYVEANSEAEAQDMYDDGMVTYEEKSIDCVVEVDEFSHKISMSKEWNADA